MEASGIVARFLNGRVVKGYTQNFFPNFPVFYVLPMDAASKTDPEEIQVSELKAVFFVRDFFGNKGYDERKGLAPGEKVQGRLMEVTFRDGDVLLGSTTGYDPKRSGFFFFPIDPNSNNIKAYFVSSAPASRQCGFPDSFPVSRDQESLAFPMRSNFPAPIHNHIYASYLESKSRD